MKNEKQFCPLMKMVTYNWQFIMIPKIKVVCVLNWHFEIHRGLPSFYHASHQRIDSLRV